MGQRFTRFMENASNVAVLVVSGVLLFTLYSGRQMGGSERPLIDSSAELVGHRIGAEHLPGEPGIRKLILALSQTCRFCEKEMPFYRTLADSIGANTALIAVFPESEPDPEPYMEAQSVRAYAVKSVRFSDMGIKATPTILLVDAGGLILRGWVGALPEEKHKEVLEYVKSVK